MLKRIMFAGAALSLTVAVVSAQRRGGGGQPDGLSFRFLGPAVGNRA